MLIGCSSNEYNPPSKPTQLAAYAASVKYPTTQPQELRQLAATVNSQNTAITLRNFGTRPVTDFNLWVNGAYVMHVDRLEPSGAATFKTENLFNAAGIPLSANAAAPIRQVQVETSDGALWNVQGPQVAPHY
jgi:hypothetical protein